MPCLKPALGTGVHKFKFAIILMLLIWLSNLAGCSDKKESTKATPQPEAVHACQVLTTPEVEAVLSGSIDEPRQTFKQSESPKHWMSMCNYYSKTRQISLGITIKPHGKLGDGQKAFDDYLAELKTALGPDYQLESIADIGEAAGWDASSKQLTIIKGPYLVIVGLVSPKLSSFEALTLCKQVSDKFLAKLPTQ